MKDNEFKVGNFVIITLLVSVWVHVSEIARFALYVGEDIKAFFNYDPNIVPMGFDNALIWGAWDTLLTAVVVFVFWLFAKVFSNDIKTVVAAGTFAWASVFVLYWVANVNTGIFTWEMAGSALIWAWAEMVMAALIASRLYVWKGELK